MGIFKDLSGMKFGRLTVIKKVGVNESRHTLWECVCECGNALILCGYNMKSGNTLSCGCLRKETSSKNASIHGHTIFSGCTKTYTSWLEMKTRCTNQNRKQWKDYGGRGITYCDRWEFFENFLSDMGERPEGKTLDRVDVNGNYCPENCRWASAIEQAANRRKPVFCKLKRIR